MTGIFFVSVRQHGGRMHTRTRDRSMISRSGALPLSHPRSVFHRGCNEAPISAPSQNIHDAAWTRGDGCPRVTQPSSVFASRFACSVRKCQANIDASGRHTRYWLCGVLFLSVIGSAQDNVSFRVSLMKSAEEWLNFVTKQRHRGTGIAQWQSDRDRKVAGSSPGRSGGVFSSSESTFCADCVTALVRKRSRSFCQKCRWQDTAKHACTLSMWLGMKWHCKPAHSCMVNPKRQQFHVAPTM